VAAPRSSTRKFSIDIVCRRATAMREDALFADMQRCGSFGDERGHFDGLRRERDVGGRSSVQEIQIAAP